MFFLVRIFIKDYENITDNKVRGKYTALCGIVGILGNLFSFVAKLIIGLVFSSIAIVSDAFNNLGDVINSSVSVFSAKISNKRADREHPFGHGRFEYVASLVVGFLIIFMAVELLREAIAKIINPVPIATGFILYLVLGFYILLKLWMFLYNRYYARKINSSVLRAAAIDSFNDILITFAIIVCMIIAPHTTFPVDGIAGLVVALVVAYSGYKVAKEAIVTLLGTPPSAELSNNITKLVKSGEGIIDAHDLIVHNYGPGCYFASIHAEVKETVNLVAIHEVIDALENEAYERYKVELTIHLDPISTSPIVLQRKEEVLAVVKKINPVFDIHDFRFIDGNKQINLLFDLVVPYGFSEEKIEALREEVTKRLKELDPRYFPKIKIESRYS
ncbi:MAG: cation diffusion facilitator family transporter [Bacilli bacterium]|jgi:cation diffusion facilitator family transporter